MKLKWPKGGRGHKLLLPVITVVTLVSLSVRSLSHGVTQIPFECSKPPPPSETSVCLLPPASLCAPARSCLALLVHLHVCENCWGGWGDLKGVHAGWISFFFFPACVTSRRTARRSSLCSRLIACFSQTQRLVPLPVTPQRGWVCDEKGAENRISVIRI